MVTTFLLGLAAAAVSRTHEGCHPVTPPPGSFGATQCNFDREFASIGDLFQLVDLFVFVPVATVVITVGLIALATARGPLPAAITRHLPREPASPRDRRLQGLSLTLSGAGILALGWALSLALSEPAAPPPPAPHLLGAGAFAIAWLGIIAGLALNLKVRQRDHRSGEVLSAWEQIARSFRA